MPAQPTGAQLPNIVYIMADDVGYGDISFYNPESKIPTPNIDRLASEGMCFSDAHAPAAVCTPTRYGVMTGRYCWRSRLRSQVHFGYEPPLIAPGRFTLASLLKSAGYRTACVGKWHLGLGYGVKPGQHVDFERPLPWDFPDRATQEKIDFTRPVTGGPTELGFDYFFGTSGSSTHQAPYGFIENDRFVVPPTIYFDPPEIRGKPGLPKPGMMAPGWDNKAVDPTFCKKAVEFIEQQSGADKPFFLYLASAAVHEPCTPADVPDFASGKSQAGPRGDLAWLFDWMVGQVLAALDQTGQAENTLVIVTSDNGALPGDRVVVNGQVTYRMYGHKSCGDWRGYKAHIWEGGHRIPLLVRWPGRVSPGTVTDSLLCLTDILATVASVVRVQPPDNAAEDSFDMLPVLLGDRSVQPIRDGMVHHSGFGVFSLRHGRWKLILETQGSGGWPLPAGGGPVPGSPGQLYDLVDDPWEKQNLWDACPEVVASLTALLRTDQAEGRTAPLRHRG